MIGIASKAVIPSLEASKRNGCLLRALTCYSYYFHLKNSELLLILWELFYHALLNLIYVLWLLVLCEYIYIYVTLLMPWRCSRWLNGMRLIVHMEFLHDGVYGLSYSGICTASHSLHWHMELCRRF
jgi:hypothetical protein